jgi:hypothetical protein
VSKQIQQKKLLFAISHILSPFLSFETENGIEVAEVGRLENIGTADEGLRSEGFYQYTGDDGVVYRVDYVADANGGFVARVRMIFFFGKLQIFNLLSLL